jgi:heat shock protein HslJ
VTSCAAVTGKEFNMFTRCPARLVVAFSALLLVACAAQSEFPTRAATPETVVSGNRVQILKAHHWRLESATDGRNQRIAALSPDEGRAIVFGFTDDRISIQGGCNVRGGAYQITAASQLQVGRMVTTMMACEPTLMQADAALSDLLTKPLQIEVANGASPRLRLVSASNETLVFTGRATPEALYGAPTIVFLEVAAQRIACSRPLAVGARCIQVRERHYDPQGLVIGKPGEWQPLFEDIEGFTHTEGERNVLRVKRFKRTSVPAGASANLYVLDLIVESEIVTR